MSKSAFSQAVRSEYKEKVREIKIKANIYNETIGPSNNLLPIYQGTITNGTISLEYNNGEMIINANGQDEDIFINDFEPFTLNPGTYTISLTSFSNKLCSFNLVNTLDYEYDVIVMNVINDGGETGTYTIDESINIDTLWIQTSIDDMNYVNEKYQIMLNEGNYMPFEPSGNAKVKQNIITIGEGTKPSKNLLPIYTKTTTYINTKYGYITYNNGEIDIKDYFLNFHNDYATDYDMPSVELQPGTYTFSFTSDRTTNYSLGHLELWYHTHESLPPYVDTKIFDIDTSSSTSQTITIEETITMNQIRINGFEFAENTPYDDKLYLMLNVGSTALPFEEPGDILNPQILDFDVDEKSDIYFESMPFSELSVDVDNTDGFFSDFTQNSIVSNLTKDVLIDFYLNVNNTGWCNAWTMQFDSLKATNEKATLTFKPYCVSVINEQQIYDKNKYFYQYAFLDMQKFSQYMSDNYDITLEQDEQIGDVIMSNYEGKTKVSNLFLEYAGGVSNLEQGQMLCILDNKRLRYKLNTRLGTAQEDLTNNEILEKPLITKEILEGIVKNSKTIESYTNDTSVFHKEINSIFKNSTEVLVIYGEEYNMSGINSNEISITNGTLVSVNWTADGGTSGLGSHYILLEISGNIGDRYTITINANLPRVDQVKTSQEIYAKGNYTTTDNFIKLNAYEYTNTYYWEKLVRNLEKKIKLKIKALPYLQVGDTISLENEGNVVIAEIHTSWSNGFIMEIVAYKVKYTLL